MQIICFCYLIYRYDVKAKGEEVLSRRRRATGSSGSAGGQIFQFFVPPASLSPGVIFVGFHLPGKPYIL